MTTDKNGTAPNTPARATPSEEEIQDFVTDLSGVHAFSARESPLGFAAICVRKALAHFAPLESKVEPSEKEIARLVDVTHDALVYIWHDQREENNAKDLARECVSAALAHFAPPPPGYSDAAVEALIEWCEGRVDNLRLGDGVSVQDARRLGILLAALRAQKGVSDAE